jgi:hypothetical protein
VSALSETRYRCPGESYFIDRPIHLARLAEGFAACRNCSHRFDSGLRPLNTTSADHCAADDDPQHADRQSADALCALPHANSSEGPQGVARNEIDVPLYAIKRRRRPLRPKSLCPAWLWLPTAAG